MDTYIHTYTHIYKHIYKHVFFFIVDDGFSSQTNYLDDATKAQKLLVPLTTTTAISAAAAVESTAKVSKPIPPAIANASVTHTYKLCYSCVLNQMPLDPPPPPPRRL